MIRDSQNKELVKSEQFLGSVKTQPVSHRLSSVAALGSHGLGCGNFPLSVRLGA
jgi:hypothetical protein